MRCLLCQRLSLPIICVTCQKSLLQPSLSTRTLTDDFKVFSFYRYHDIAPLLKTKHTHIGASVYKILADCAFKEFVTNFHYPDLVYGVGIDDHCKDGYAHTAILTKSLLSKGIKPLYGRLRAGNDISYSGKDLAYRLTHKREFSYHDSDPKQVILVDDIITTGSTILEARNSIKKAGSTPIFALTLADSREL